MSEPAGFRARLISTLGPDSVWLDEPLKKHTAFRIGGPADAFVRPFDRAALQAVLRIASEEGQPVTVLGTGSNVLVSDAGLRGVTLRLAGELADVHLGVPVAGSAEVEVGAGALNAQLVALALRVGLVGIEFLATIPGTFGGALIMNAGAHGSEIGSFVRSVSSIDRALGLADRDAAQCGFAYRSSAFPVGEILTGAVLQVPLGDPAAARDHLRQMRAARRRTQPLGLPNAGSIFKNPPGDHAGRLIEAAGLKGARIGGASVSELHANFIVNEGGATAADVSALAEQVQSQVAARFGVRLEWEVRRLGVFAQNDGSTASSK